MQGKGSNIVLETPLKAIQKKGGSGHSVRALHPLPQTGIVYWEVVFSSQLSRKGGSLGEHCMTGVVNGKERGGGGSRWQVDGGWQKNLEWQQDDGEVFRRAKMYHHPHPVCTLTLTLVEHVGVQLRQCKQYTLVPQQGRISAEMDEPHTHDVLER